MAENNILKIIKEAGLSQAEVIALIKKEEKSKGKELLTQEEKAAETKAKAEAKIQAEAEAKKKAEKEKDKIPPEEPEEDPIVKQLDAIQAKLDELEKSGKIPGKTPSKGKETEKGDLPESVQFTVQKNMFEVDV